MNTKIDKQAFSIIESAERASVGRSTIYEEIKAGHLIASKIGKRTVITKINFDKWINNLATA